MKKVSLKLIDRDNTDMPKAVESKIDQGIEWGLSGQRATDRTNQKSYGKKHTECTPKGMRSRIFWEYAMRRTEILSRLNKLLTETNEAVYDLLKLTNPEKWLIEDLLSVRMKLNEGRSPLETTRSQTPMEIREYANILKEELDGFLDNEIKDPT